MKKGFKLFTLAFALLFAAVIKVSASSITNWADLKTCLTTAGTATCETTGKITADAENITVVGDKTLVLGDTLTIANRFKVDSGTKLVVKGNVTATGQFMFMAEAGSTLELESGVFTSTYKGAVSSQMSVIVSVFGQDQSGKAKTYVKVAEGVEFKDGGFALYQDRATEKAAYGVEVDFYGKVSMSKNGTVTYNSFTVLGNIKAMTGNDLPIINIYEGSSITNDGGPAIYGAGYAIWNIEGGTFTGSEALSIKAGQFNITGGKFVANGEYVSPENVQAQNSASENTGAAISITGNDGYAAGVELNISNVIVESKNGYAIFEGITKGVTPAVKNMNIYDGDYTGKVAAVYSENEEGFIYGGTFNKNLEKEYLFEDIKVEEEDGNFVAKFPFDIVLPAEIKNGTITAPDKAYKGEKVKLEVKPEKGYVVSKLTVTTIDLIEVKVTDNSFEMPEDHVYVDVEFEKEPVKEEIPNTGDNVLFFVVIGLLSLGVAALATNKLRKNA